MNYELWTEPGQTGRKYYVFTGLKTSDQIAEAVKMIASERKMNKLDLIVNDACIKGEDLYIDGYIPGTKKAHAITKREGERWTKKKSH